MKDVRIINGDCREVMARMPAGSVHCCVTSPPYWGLRDYEHAEQIGLEQTPEEYVATMVAVARGVRRVLRDDGTFWLNLGDSYGGGSGKAGGQGATVAGHGRSNLNKQRRALGPPNTSKQLLGIPWRVALALQADGWLLRGDYIWAKPNPMPESVRDRCTRAHEYIFHFAKGPKYFFDQKAIEEPITAATTEEENRNKRSVWTIPLQPYGGAHFAAFPAKLARTCILAGTSEWGACEVCGAPVARVVERRRVATRDPENSKVLEKRKINSTPGRSPTSSGPTLGSVVGNRDPERHTTATRTVGWEPTCQCGGLVVPCTVLDPFAGSGTTLATAARHGRRAIGIELNPEYIPLIEARVAKARREKGFGL